MATCITPVFGNNYSPQAQLTVNQSSETSTTVTLSWSIDYVGHGSAPVTNGAGRAWSVVIDGKTVGSGSFNINGLSSNRNISSGSTVVSKSSSARSVSFSVSFAFNITWNGTYGGTKTASGSLSIGGSGSSGGGGTTGGGTYTVRYYANGGSGAPSSQTKKAGSSLQLSNTRPTRSGYEFMGWATSSTSSTVRYQPGAYYYTDANLSLYAVWKAIEYTISYNANGGTGAPAAQTKEHGTSIRLSSTVPTRTGYQFQGWSVSSTSSIASYSPGDLYTANGDTTLYAVWVYIADSLQVNNLSLQRCTSSGTITETGTYAKISFSWQAKSGLDSLIVGYRTSGSTGSYTNTTVATSGTSGSVNRVIGNGSFDSETNYDFQIVIEDKNGLSATYWATLSTIAYVIDFRSGGKGLTIGEAATSDGFHVRMDSNFHNPVTTSSTFTANSTATFNDEAVFTDVVNAANATYLRLPDDVRINNTTFLTPQWTSDRPLITNHIALDNGIYLQAAKTNNTAANVLRMNTSNQLELYWGSSYEPLGGDVRKVIWSGVWSASSSSKTIPEIQAYNVFIVSLTSGSLSREHATKVLAVKGFDYGSSTSGRIAGVGGMPSSGGAGTFYSLSVLFSFSGSSLTFQRAGDMPHVEGSSHGTATEYRIAKIEGLI